MEFAQSFMMSKETSIGAIQSSTNVTAFHWHFKKNFETTLTRALNTQHADLFAQDDGFAIWTARWLGDPKPDAH
eukprot:4929022-Amphidinium_carterae.2